MTQIKLDLDPYSIRVLDVVKGIHGLKNRNEAFKKFVAEYGPNYVQMNLREEVLRDLDNTLKEHKKKYGTRVMSDDELDKILGL
jgi:hypothetical protein